jgi:hypothetical protein
VRFEWYQIECGSGSIGRVVAHLQKGKGKCQKMEKNVTLWQYKDTDSLTGSGSGWVAVVPLDRGDRCGSNGTKLRVAVAVLAELWRWQGGSAECLYPCLFFPCAHTQISSIFLPFFVQFLPIFHPFSLIFHPISSNLAHFSPILAIFAYFYLFYLFLPIFCLFLPIFCLYLPIFLPIFLRPRNASAVFGFLAHPQHGQALQNFTVKEYHVEVPAGEEATLSYEFTPRCVGGPMLAVVVCSWYRRIEESSAVRMV